MGALVAYAVGKLVIRGLNKANTVSETVTAERMEKTNAAYRDQIGLGKAFKFDNAPFDDYVEAKEHQKKCCKESYNIRNCFVCGKLEHFGSTCVI
jgi:hypothetical protein